MANHTSWTGGNLNSGALTYFPAFNASDLNSLASLSSVLSTVATFDNEANVDQFMDISFVGQLSAASTLASGAALAFFLFTLQGDGTTLGDGRMTAGTQVASTTYGPLLNSCGGIPLAPGTSITNIAGSSHIFTLPPRKFRLAIQNQSGFAFAAGGLCSCWISTYRQNTNA